MNVVGIIAARMASTRFPSKPLAIIRGVPMIGHVYHRSAMSVALDAVWVATCDDQIMQYAASIGAPAVMTKDSHERATERIAEAMLTIEAQTGTTVDVAVLIQADEPMLVPAMLDELVAPMRSQGVAVANLMATIEGGEEFDDPNTVKVVLDRERHALYFSRESVPSRRKHKGEVPMWKQLGLIAFTRAALMEFAAMPPTPLEVIESVDMNRLLEHGRRILMVETTHRTVAVDVPLDLAKVESLMAEDHLVARYGPRTAPAQGLT